MKARLTTIYAGPAGTKQPGDQVEGDLAKALVAGGYAVEIAEEAAEPAPAKPEAEPAPETASVASAEKAVKKRGRPRKDA